MRETQTKKGKEAVGRKGLLRGVGGGGGSRGWILLPLCRGNAGEKRRLNAVTGAHSRPEKTLARCEIIVSSLFGVAQQDCIPISSEKPQEQQRSANASRFPRHETRANRGQPCGME